MHHHLSWLEAAVVGLFQGVSELFPVSSLGHSVLIPALVGGQWARDLDVTKAESPYLAYIVGLHVATALALLLYFWRDWIRIIGGFLTSVRDRGVRTPDQHLAWALIIGTIPVGLVGLIFEHTFRTTFGNAKSASIFLAANGLILLLGEVLRRRAPASAPAAAPARVAAGGAGSTDAMALADDERVGDRAVASDARLGAMSLLNAVVIGSAQIGALLAGISRSGITMVAGLLRGLSHEDAARFSFLLATPVILAAGVLKLPDLFGPLGSGIRGQVLLGSVLSGVGAYVSVSFLDRYFRTRTLVPFGIYCLLAGLACVVRFFVFA